MVTRTGRRGRGGGRNLHTQLWVFAQTSLFDDFERDVGTTNPHRNAVLAERLAHHRVFLPVRRLAKADVRAALEARTTWEHGTWKERRAAVVRWVREEIFPLAVLKAINAMWTMQTVRFTWSQWMMLQSHYRWTHVHAASWRRGGRVTLVVRPVLLPRPALAHCLRATAIRFAGEQIIGVVRELEAPRVLGGTFDEIQRPGLDPVPEELGCDLHQHEQDPQAFSWSAVAEAVHDLAATITRAAVWTMSDRLPPADRPLYRAWLENWPAARIEDAFHWTSGQRWTRESRLRARLRKLVG
jgi:hypothetical protein